jgi:hypothetical protein
MDAIRMIGFSIASRAGSGKDLGKHQSATNSKARSDVPTQIMNRPIGISISRRHTIPDSSLLNVVTAGIPVGEL